MSTVDKIMALVEHSLEYGSDTTPAIRSAVESMAQELETYRDSCVSKADRIDRLGETNSQLFHELEAANALAQSRLEQMTADRRQYLDLKAKLDALEPDAARYRWLRDASNLHRDHREVYTALVEGFTAKEIEDAIDAAMQGEQL